MKQAPIWPWILPPYKSIITASTGEINKIKDLVNVPIVLTSPVVRIY